MCVTKGRTGATILDFQPGLSSSLVIHTERGREREIERESEHLSLFFLPLRVSGYVEQNDLSYKA